MELWLYYPANDTSSLNDRYQWFSIDTCRLNVTIPESGKLPMRLTTGNNETKQLCRVKIPNAARYRSSNPRRVKPLKAKFVFQRQSSLDETRVVSTVPFELTRVKEYLPSLWSRSSDSASKEPHSRNLLEKPFAGDESNAGNNGNKAAMWIPYLKYGRAPIRIRIVAEYRDYGGELRRKDGLVLPRWNHTTYSPVIYVDDLSLQQSAEIEVAESNDEKPPIDLDIRFGAVSPVVDSIIRQVHLGFAALEPLLPLAGEEMDEIRYFLQDERLYRFLLTQIISYVHMYLDYLAFRDEIRFYKGRQNLTGVSASSVISHLVCSIIILLYLVDGGGTSWVVLVSLLSSCLVEAWKVWKLLRPTFQTSFPFVSVRQLHTAKEQETAEYDRIAYRYLSMILYPLVICWSVYALKHYEYKSWYSWLISNLANAVYTFGFISLCPQLYVNYRLKSVAHLPWKVFLYKIFNTFVDDAFAWLIEMPWKHRIMTLRDDVVFMMFLVQVYLYRVDKTRTNEFGYSYEEEVPETKEKQSKEKQE
eukprot:CAMPEP_0178937952 /NCGR_PEP_ID=MMETSP0786-20121207/26057_1 /TAXON_ID=186022 /ORGANISM="Thalassionema frauenfeldii, Strain CCMP 1798" /LENGTH=530 /DNA_ID=CAMNT_0020616609 /DNA_START=315 /DNA_END=1907 /DNA_ORIENTATION=+